MLAFLKLYKDPTFSCLYEHYTQKADVNDDSVYILSVRGFYN